MNHNSNTPTFGNPGYDYIQTNPGFKEDWNLFIPKSYFVTLYQPKL